MGRVCDELDGHFFGRGSEVGVVELIDWPLWRGEVDWQEGALNVDATGYFDGCNGQDLSQTLTCVHTIPIESRQTFNIKVSLSMTSLRKYNALKITIIIERIMVKKESSHMSCQPDYFPSPSKPNIPGCLKILNIASSTSLTPTGKSRSHPIRVHLYAYRLHFHHAITWITSNRRFKST